MQIPSRALETSEIVHPWTTLTRYAGTNDDHRGICKVLVAHWQSRARLDDHSDYVRVFSFSMCRYKSIENSVGDELLDMLVAPSYILAEAPHF